jgi:hypothetical protein
MQWDVNKSLTRDIKLLQGQLVRDYLRHQGSVQLASGVASQQQALHNSRNEEMKVMQRCLPHFSIRMIRSLE